MYQAAKALGELCKVGAKVALLATRDGLLIESVANQQPPSDLDDAAAGAASALEAAKLMVSGLTPACVQGVLVELERGTVMTVHQINDEMILAVLADTIGGLGRLLVELRRLIPMIAAAVDVGAEDSASLPLLDASAKAEAVHRTYEVSPETTSPRGDQEATFAGSLPQPSRRDLDGAVRGAKRDHASRSFERPEPSAAKETEPRSGNQRELASLPAPGLPGLATGSAVDALPPQDTEGITPNSVGVKSGLRSAATTRSEREIGIRLAGVHLDVTGQVATATIEVAYQERRAAGKAVGRHQPERNLFLVAEATAQAATKLLPPHHGVMVEAVPSFSSGAVEAWPRLIWLSPTDAEEPLQRVKTDNNSPEGMANAVVHAVNERFGALLATP